MIRIFDIFLSLVALIALAPLLLLIMLILRFTGENKIFLSARESRFRWKIV